MNGPDLQMDAAQRAQAARDDAVWKYRFFMSAGLTLSISVILLQFPGITWLALMVIVPLAIAAGHAARQYLWPTRHWAGAARERGKS